MQAPGDRTTSWVNGSRALVLSVLGCGLAARAFDANPHLSWTHVPFVVACYALPLWYSSGVGRRVWRRHPALLLVLQAVATYAPFAVLGSGWVGGVSGLLGGLVLLGLPGRTGWPLFAALLVLEPLLWLWVGLPYEPAGNALFWLVNAYVVSAMGCYALNRLVDLLGALAVARHRMVGDAVTRQRLSAGAHLRERIVGRLALLAQRAGAVVDTAGDPELVRAELVAIGRLAREAAADARQLLVELPDPLPVEDSAGAAFAPRLARGVTIAVVGFFAAQAMLNVLVRPQPDRVGAGLAVLTVVVGAVTALLTLRHLDIGPAGSPARWWPGSLGLSAVLTVSLALDPAVGSSALALLALVAASGLVVVRHWSRWLFPVSLVAVVPVLTLSQPAFDLVSRRDALRWATYASASMVSACLLVYGLARLTRASVALQQAQQEAVDAAALGEQLRLAQDAHDTLGLGLSTIALKSDLALSLMDSDPERSRHEAVQLMHLARVVASDAEAVAEGRAALDLEQELLSARGTLDAAGVRATVALDGPVPPEAKSVLATVLREAVTNVIRHSRATTCAISVRRDGPGLVLRVTNDRAAPPRTTPGLGLSSMSDRLGSVGGRLTTRRIGDRFEVTATVPLEDDALVAR